MTKKNKGLLIVISIIVTIVIFGTVFYHYVEDWSLIDSFYFTVVTMTTVGYGDLYPTHSISKLLTSVFIIVAIPIIFFAFAVIAEDYLEKRMQKMLSRESKKEIEEIRHIEKSLEKK